MPKISALPPADRASAADEIPAHNVGDGETQKITVEMLMPTGTIMDYAGATAPDGFLLCYGQSLNAASSPEYADLYAIIGTTYGGTGITAFNVPDLRGRVAAGQDDMGGTSANRLTSPLDGDVLGGSGGTQTHALTIAELAAHTHSVDNTMSFTQTAGASNFDPGAVHVGANANRYDASPQNMGATSGSAGSGTAHPNVQPTIILNKIIKY